MDLIDKLIEDAQKDDFENNVRLTLNPLQYLKMLEIIRESRSSTDELVQEIANKKTYIQRNNFNKTIAADIATQARVDKAKKLIVDAIDYIKRNDLKLNQSAIAKASGCSVNTVRKYNYLFKD